MGHNMRWTRNKLSIPRYWNKFGKEQDYAIVVNIILAHVLPVKPYVKVKEKKR